MFKRELTTVTTKDNSLTITIEIIPVDNSFYYVTKTISNNKITCDLSDSQGNIIKDLPIDFNFTQEEIYGLQNDIMNQKEKSESPKTLYVPQKPILPMLPIFRNTNSSPYDASGRSKV